MDLGKRIAYTVSGQKVTLTFEHGEAEIRAVAPGIVNVFRGLESREHTSGLLKGTRSRR